MGKLTERWATIYLVNEIKAVEDQLEDLENALNNQDPAEVVSNIKSRIRATKNQLQGLRTARDLIADSYKIHCGKPAKDE